jgi:hypothetical protein
MRQVYSALDELDAHFLRDLLREDGIEAVVQDEASGQVWAPSLSGTGVPSVWVNDEDVARALTIVNQYGRRHLMNRTSSPAANPTWKCPRCGEEVEIQFTECWNCGADRPADVIVAPPGAPGDGR